MRAVNLLPDAPRRRPRRSAADAASLRALMPVAAAAGVLLIAGLTYWGVSARSEAADRADRLAEAVVLRDALRVQLDDYRVIAEDDSRRQARQGVIVNLAAGRTGWDRLIRDVATVLPEGVWITDLTGTAAEPADPSADPSAGTTAGAGSAEAITAGARLLIDGRARGQKAVAATMARVGTIAGLGEPVLVSSGREDIAGKRVVRFRIEVPVDRRAQDRAVVVPVTNGGTP